MGQKRLRSTDVQELFYFRSIFFLAQLSLVFLLTFCRRVSIFRGRGRNFLRFFYYYRYESICTKALQLENPLR